jgi:hypothetical protein
MVCISRSITARTPNRSTPFTTPTFSITYLGHLLSPIWKSYRAIIPKGGSQIFGQLVLSSTPADMLNVPDCHIISFVGQLRSPTYLSKGRGLGRRRPTSCPQRAIIHETCIHLPTKLRTICCPKNQQLLPRHCSQRVHCSKYQKWSS